MIHLHQALHLPDHPLNLFSNQTESLIYVVVYGIDESPPNTDRPSRLQNDIKNVLTAFTPILTTLESRTVFALVHLIPIVLVHGQIS